jgi:hypothetical protein
LVQVMPSSALKRRIKQVSKLYLIVASVPLVLAATMVDARAGTPVYVGTKQTKQASMNDIDHSDWNALLAKYVDKDGQVNYQAWKATSADVALLDKYLRHLSSARRQVAASREARLAFWINAYNAGTIRGILREYPTTSIRNHTAKLWGYNIWKDLKLYVGGEPVSLDAMEHEILRKMSEPRIHFAIVCASIGCPRLLNQAYQADKLDAQLETNAKDFFSRRQNFQYDANSKQFYVSAILDWFGEDFGANQQARLRRIASWLPTPAATDAAKRNAVSVSYLDYHWNLNKQ